MVQSKTGKDFIWLVNLFGTPCSPSSFNPDNSLASLAGSLVAHGFRAQILDFQTVRFCSQLIAPEVGNRMYQLIGEIAAGGRPKENDTAVREWIRLDQVVQTHQEKLMHEVARELAAKIARERPLFLGFKLYSGGGQRLTLEVVRRLRRLGVDTPFVGGGPLVRILGSAYHRLYPEFDYLLDGEAELSIVALAQALSRQGPLEAVAGLSFRDSSGRLRNQPPQWPSVLNELPDPDYSEEVYPALYERDQKTLVFQLDESRGCPNSCHFCIHPTINGNQVRCFDPSRVVALMGKLQKWFGASAFRLTGSNTPQKFLLKLADEIERARLKIHYSCYGSVNMTNPQVLDRLIATGMVGIFIGMETLDTFVLEQMFNKRQDVARAKNLVKECLRQGLYTTTSWMYPAPQQRADLEQEMVGYIADAYAGLTTDHGSVMVVPSLVLPNTAWYRDPGRFGFQLGERDTYLRQYAEIDFSLHRPRALLAPLDQTTGNQPYRESLAQCDQLIQQLEARGVPLNITDDWMLMGKLSGLSMDEFRRRSIQSIVTGDYAAIESIVASVNENTRRGYWPTRDALFQIQAS